MAAPFPTTYYIGIGTAISNTGVPTEISGGSYARQACNFSGTALSGLSQSFSAWVVATAPSPAVPMIYGLLYDALTGGNLIGYWTWNPGASGYTTSLTAFPATTVAISFYTYIQTALNLAVQGGQATSGSLIDAGSQIGTVNGNPFIAGTRLSINSGGSLVAHMGSGQWIGSADVQNSFYANAYASSNILNGITALAGGGQSGATLLSGFINRITTVGTAADSCILPTTAMTPGGVGSFIMVNNNAASNAAAIFPDVGSAINALSTNTSLSLAVSKSALFFRITSLLWITVPYVPS